MGYRKGGVVGTPDYSKQSYDRGGVIGTSEYSKKPRYEHGGMAKKKKNAYQDGGVVKQYTKKRKGWDDMGDGMDKHYYSGGGISNQVIKGKEYGSRKGWGDHEGSRLTFKNIGGNAGNKEKFSKRQGWNDHGVEHAYQDGGIVSARLNALEDLRDQMASIGGESLNNFNPNAYEDGGIVEDHGREDESENESSIDLDDLSRDQLIELLKNR